MNRLLTLIFVLLVSLSGRAGADDALAEALRHVDRQDWAAAAAAAERAGPLAADIVTWHRLRAAAGTAAEYPAFAARRADWPGLPLLLQKGEPAVAAAGADAVLAYFDQRNPATGAGALALARAFRGQGKAGEAETAAVRAWLELPLLADQQTAFLAEFGTVLAPRHTARLDAMIWAGRAVDAERMLALVPAGWRASGAARLGLMAGVNGVDGLIAAVPAEFANGAGLAHARFSWRMDRGRLDDAADLLLERSTAAAGLGRPGVWAGDRAALARREMRTGDAARAYRLAADHHLSAGSDYADLEWLAGYIALQKLGDPALALRHFQNLRIAVKSAISLGRAGYWEGRAYAAMGDDEAARAAYAFAAEYQTGFYGLLAAEKAGLPMDAALSGGDSYPDWQAAGFMTSSVLQVGLALQKAGARDLATRFLVHLAEGLQPVELGQLADLALALDEPHIALMVAKQAAERGVILNRAYYPVTGLARMQLPVPPELALAIARRESEFDFAVISKAGARGLMQVMPGTAKLMAPKVGVDYVPAMLTGDPDYNARLGAAYLAELRAEFGPSLVLVAAGYNAGPGRPRRWITELGDPRAAGVDPVDWIEAVPFTETRTYIMRVAESMLIYRARLAGKPVEIRLTAELQGR